MEEGDTLASIAEEVGTTPEDLAALNPDLDGEEAAAGDRLEVPEPDYSGESSEEEVHGEGVVPVPEAGEGGEEGVHGEGVVPVPEDDPPGDPGFSDLVIELLEFIPFSRPIADPVGLKLEVHAAALLGGRGKPALLREPGEPGTALGAGYGW